MKTSRRNILKVLGVTAGAVVTGGVSAAAAAETNAARRPVLTVAHITDVHIRDVDNAPENFKKCLAQIVAKHKPDFFLNGGDSIFDASYKNVPREQVTKYWGIWDDCIKQIGNYKIYSCIGNHDSWWSAPNNEDAMYGKPYVVKRLGIPNRYYSFDKGGWHFIVLDGNNANIKLDDEQYAWLEADLAKLAPGTPVLTMSHYPILGATILLEGGGHSDFKKLKDLFYKHKDKVKICLSGHNHLLDNTVYNNVRHCCNGAMSGYWWGRGDKESAGKGYFKETPPGYAVLKFYADGAVENVYYPHDFIA